MPKGLRTPGWFLLAMLCVCAYEPAALAQQNATGGGEQLWGEFAVKPFKIVGNLYVVGLSNNTSYLITTPAGHLLINPTLVDATQDVRSSIEQLGFNVRDIKYILQTHA